MISNVFKHRMKIVKQKSKIYIMYLRVLLILGFLSVFFTLAYFTRLSLLVKFGFILWSMIILVFIREDNAIHGLCDVENVNGALVRGAGNPVRVFIKCDGVDLCFVTATSHFLKRRPIFSREYSYKCPLIRGCS